MNKQRRAKITEIVGKLSAIVGDVDSVYNEEESVYDNMPENLQGSYKYEQMEENISHMDDAKSSIYEAISSLEEVC